MIKWLLHVVMVQEIEKDLVCLFVCFSYVDRGKFMCRVFRWRRRRWFCCRMIWCTLSRTSLRTLTDWASKQKSPLSLYGTSSHENGLHQFSCSYVFRVEQQCSQQWIELGSWLLALNPLGCQCLFALFHFDGFFCTRVLKVAMVVAAMSALAMDSMAHIVGEGPLINAEKVLSGGVGSITFYES